MSSWQAFHQAQVESDINKGEEREMNNYVTEFLIVYIKDLLCSIPTDHSIISNVATRIAAAASALSHKVRYNFDVVRF